MKQPFSIPPAHRRIFEVVSRTAEKTGIPAYVVGGYVRDLLLGRPLKNDIDFTLLGDVERFAREVAREWTGKPRITIYKRFGTAMVKNKDTVLEFVTARKESYSPDSRKPRVKPATLEEDLRRRDFTVNAMAVGLYGDDYMKLIDLFGGKDDLEKKIIRTPTDPHITFSDDPLRMMRAVRFATQLDFDLAPELTEAIKANKERLKIVSPERIIDELNKILLTDKPSKGLRLLFETGLLEQFFPELVALHGVEEVEGKTHKDNFYHTLQVVDNIARADREGNLWLRWAALLHDIGKPASKRFHPETGWTFHGHEVLGSKMIPGIFRRLHMPLNRDMKYVQKLVKLSARPIALTEDHVTDSAVRRLLFEAGDEFEDLMKLCEADITTKNRQRKQRYIANLKRVMEKVKEVEERDRIRNFQPPVTGEMIMETFGLKPSRMVGEIKEAIKEAILDGIIPNRFEDAYRYMLKVGKQKGLEVKKEIPPPEDKNSGRKEESDKA
ncbi:MAG: HD domain-containing protein [Chlorobi bacterium]|nr:HD domain-containing protein [Chlorobiota bacterium]